MSSMPTSSPNPTLERSPSNSTQRLLKVFEIFNMFEYDAERTEAQEGENKKAVAGAAAGDNDVN